MLKVIHKKNRGKRPSPTVLLEARPAGPSPRAAGANSRAAALRILCARGWRRSFNPTVAAMGAIVASSVVGLTTLGLSSSAFAETGSLNLSANVAEAGLELTLSSDSAVLNLAPPYSGSSSANTSVSVEVKTRNGYQLFMSSNGTGALVESNDSTKTIPGLSSETCNTSGGSAGCSIGDDNAFPVNRWGFNANLTSSGSGSGSTNNNYIGLPIASAYNIGSSEIGAGSSTDGYIGNYTVNFGAKVDYTQAPGVYSNTINFIAVSNPSKVYMQDMDTLQCTNSPMTVFDIRDESSYKVQRLADGNCWMLDNLALGSTATSYNLTSGDTNLPEGTSFTLPISASGTSGSNAWADSYTDPYINAGGNCISTAGTNDYPCKNADSTNNLGGAYTKDTVAVKPDGYNIGENGSGKIGVYYNYCAASAGTYCKPNDVTATAPEGGSIAYDVCPKGWRLPTSSNLGEFRALYQAYGGSATGIENNTDFKAALSTPLSGGYWASSAHEQGVGGFFWSSTWRSNANMYYLIVNASAVNPASNNSRISGRSVRCIMQTPAEESLGYMQDLTKEQAANFTEGEAYLFTDSRDGKTYHVAKLKDGNVWMLDNLALDPTADNGNGGTIIDNMNSTNTNASDQSIAILKGGADAVENLDNTSKKYASSGITTTWKQNIITASTVDNKTMWTDHTKEANWETERDNYTDNWTVPRVNVANINTMQNQNWNTNQGGDYKIGVYYNYCSASAGTYCYDGPVYDASSSAQGVASAMTGSPDTDTSATEDICPAGWSMPTGGNSGEFRALYQAYGGSATGSENNVAFKTALSTPLSGYVHDSSGAVVGVGAYGYWWSSTRSNTIVMYGLYMDASNVYPASYYSRSGGFSIRCVLR